MITTGIDLLEISRLDRPLQNTRFINRVFGPLEKIELEAAGFSSQRAASSFTAKEAFGKALGVGIRGFSLSEVEVLHENNGRPYFLLSGNAKIMVEENKLSLSLSITHTKQYAAAFVVAYGDNERQYQK